MYTHAWYEIPIRRCNLEAIASGRIPIGRGGIQVYKNGMNKESLTPVLSGFGRGQGRLSSFGRFLTYQFLTNDRSINIHRCFFFLFLLCGYATAQLKIVVILLHGLDLCICVRGWKVDRYKVEGIFHRRGL